MIYCEWCDEPVTYGTPGAKGCSANERTWFCCKDHMLIWQLGERVAALETPKEPEPDFTSWRCATCGTRANWTLAMRAVWKKTGGDQCPICGRGPLLLYMETPSHER